MVNILGSLQATVKENLYVTLGGSITTTLNYRSFNGLDVDTIEANAQCRVPVAKTFSKLWIYISANSLNVTTTIKFRDDGVDGNLVLSITNAVTGVFTDDVNSDSPALDSLCNFVTGGEASSGSATVKGCSWLEETP